MSVSLTNRDDIIVNSINLIQQTGLYDIGDNLIETVATLPSKANRTAVCEKTQTYNQTEVNALLSGLSDASLEQKNRI